MSRRGFAEVSAPSIDERNQRYLRHNTQLIRRAAIRKILAGRFYTDGIESVEEIARLLKIGHDITVSPATVARDLSDMGAIKVQDVDRPSIAWWVVPAHNPNTENLREALDPELVEQEVAHKLLSHATDVVPIGPQVFVQTEPRAGYLVAYWLSWLQWQGIVFVQEQLDGCIIHCVNDKVAFEVVERLLGDKEGAMRGAEEATPTIRQGSVRRPDGGGSGGGETS